MVWGEKHLTIISIEVPPSRRGEKEGTLLVVTMESIEGIMVQSKVGSTKKEGLFLSRFGLKRGEVKKNSEKKFQVRGKNTEGYHTS